MDYVSLLLSAVLFAAFVPGVLVKLPPKGSPMVVLAVHAVLFALATALVMGYYFTGRFELFGNHGATCPNGYVPGLSKTGAEECLPAGHATYPATAK